MIVVLLSVGLVVMAYSPARMRPSWRSLPRMRRKVAPPPVPDMGMIVTEVATRLRCGASIHSAWRQTLMRAGIGDAQGWRLDEVGVPRVLRHLGRWQSWRSSLVAQSRRGRSRFGNESTSSTCTRRNDRTRSEGGVSDPVSFSSRELWMRNSGKQRKNGRHQRRSKQNKTLAYGVKPTIAVCRMTHSTGAPAADVLDACAHGITELAEAEGARRAALAGPRSSARTLACLPALGLALGSAIGARPLDFLLTTTYGYACLTVGFVFEIAGVIWVRALVHQAEGQP